MQRCLRASRCINEPIRCPQDSATLNGNAIIRRIHARSSQVDQKRGAQKRRRITAATARVRNGLHFAPERAPRRAPSAICVDVIVRARLDAVLRIRGRGGVRAAFLHPCGYKPEQQRSCMTCAFIRSLQKTAMA
jgi:hypothetical protein